MTESSGLIEAHGLTRRYGDFVAVDDVSFRIEAGEVVGLLGHNGAGKTTIMKMLTGFIEPSDGQTRINGMDVQDNAIAVQSLLGYLPENPPIYPELTVADYLAYAAQLRQLDPSEVVPVAIDATALRQKALDPIHTLSRGYKQRVGVAQAILHRPKFLVLDEPSNGLDPNQIQQMRDLIRQLAKTTTIILSTHIMQEVSAVCDRTIILRGGHLVVDERLDDLQRSNSIKLRTDENAQIDRLLGDVSTEITGVGGGVWQFGVSHDTNLDTAVAELATRLSSFGVPIFELGPEARDLETIFKQVSESSDLLGNEDATAPGAEVNDAA